MSQVNITVESFAKSYRDIIGHGPESQCTLDLINKARMIAYPIEDFDGSIEYRSMYINRNGLFVLPGHLEEIRSARSVNGRGIHISRDEYMDAAAYTCCHNEVMFRIDNRSYVPLILAESNTEPMAFFAVNNNDADKVVQVLYLDARGSMRDESITLLKHQQPTRLQYAPSKILRVNKGRTIGRVGVMLSQLTEYMDAHDPAPTYTIYCADVCDCYIAIKAKKKYIDYNFADFNQILDVNPEALSTLIIAIKKKSANQDNWVKEYSAAVQLAKQFLVSEKANKDQQSFATRAVQVENAFHDSLEEDNI